MISTSSTELTENFVELLENKLEGNPKEGFITKGTIVSKQKEAIFVDVSLKSEGRISKNELVNNGINWDDVEVGNEIDVYIESEENRAGCAQLSIEKVAKEKVWKKFEDALENAQCVEGKIVGKVNKGGFAVDIEGILCFLPGSQLDIRPIKDVSVLMDVQQPFMILKIDKEQGNVVVSRRAVLDESRKEAREKMLSGIKEGMMLEGTVKNITNYGAFIDLGDIDGLLHLTDISWDKISHPSEKVTLGEKLNVIVTKYNPETQRVSLGLKQITDNPWNGLDKKYIPGNRYKGKVSNISDYGLFIELQEGIEGLVYLDQIAWNSKNILPNQAAKTGEEVEVMVLDIDIEKHRISLSIKQCQENPWEILVDKYPVGTKVKAKVVKVVDFGLFVNVLEGEETLPLELLIPAIEIGFDENPKLALKKFSVGDVVDGVILNASPEKERVTISIKHLSENDNVKIANEVSKLKDVTCKILEVSKDGLFLSVIDDVVKGFVKRSEISAHRDQQRPDRFNVDDRITARVTSYDKNTRLAQMSIKVIEVEDEKKAIAEFGSVDSGASLGDILGAAIDEHNNKK